MTWSWKGKDAKEVSERFKAWKPVGKVTMHYPIHTVVGSRKAFAVVEVDDITVLARNLRQWTDICKYDISPIMNSRDLVALE